MHGKLLLNNTVIPAKLNTQGYTPSAEGDIITKGYADAFYAGLIPVSGGPVQVATTGNVDLTPGNAPSTIDGYDLSDGDGVLVWQQTDAKENGIYYYDQSAGSLVRRPDFDDNPDAEVRTNASVFVVQGDTHEGTTFFVSGSDTDVSPNITLGTHTIVWSQYSKINLTAALGTKAGSGLFAQDGKLHLGGVLTKDVTLALAADASDGERIRILSSTGLEMLRFENGASSMRGNNSLTLGTQANGSLVNLSGENLFVRSDGVVTLENEIGSDENRITLQNGLQLSNTAGGSSSSTLQLQGYIGLSQNYSGAANNSILLNQDGVALQSQEGTQNAKLVIDQGKAVFTSTASGVEYAADYSASFTARSLVDKAFVQQSILAGSHLEAVLNATDYATYSTQGSFTSVPMADGTLRVSGESYLEDTTEQAVGQFTTFSYSGLYLKDDSVSVYHRGGTRQNSNGNLLEGFNASLSSAPTGLEWSVEDELSSNRSAILISLSGMRVTDQMRNKGLTYADDYSANYEERSLVDKGWVEQYVNSSVASALPTPRTDNRELTPAASSGNDSHDTGLTLAANPKGLVIVALTGNIRPVARNDAERAGSEFYFADPAAPSVAKSFSNLAAGDKLMFNATVGGYDLEANDRLDIIYI